MRGRNFVAGLTLTLSAAGLLPAAALAADSDKVRALTEAYNISGRQLFGEMAKERGNIVLSPYSIGAAMAIVLTGAREATATEMASVLKHTLTRSDMDGAAAQTIGLLNDYGKGCAGGAPPPAPCLKLATANALFLIKSGVVSNDYIALLKANYAAELFGGAAIDDVNAWVKQKTEGKIEKILDQPEPDLTAVIVNAIYFKGGWAQPFGKGATKPQDFHLSASDKVQVPTMQKSDEFPLVTRQGFRAIRLPYRPSSVAMIIVLPDAVDGLEKVLAELTEDQQTGLFAALKRAPWTLVDLALPRFKIAFAADLVAPFKQLGLRLAFDERKADFSGMTGRPVENPRLVVSQIKHRAIVEVSEEGTEAAAATAVTMPLAAAIARPRPNPEPFRVDRPFLFYIVDDTTGAVLFQGRITDPR